MADGAEIYLKKLSVAQRQLDAAIRMVFADEDELAVFTVAAAAHRILRDIMKHNGRNAAAETWRDMMKGVATAYLAGTLPDHVRAEFEKNGVWKDIELIAEHIKAGYDLRVTFNAAAEHAHWAPTTKTANFLKHADRDPDDVISAHEIQTDYMILQAVSTYLDLIPRPTPEMEIFWALHAVKNDDLSSLGDRLAPIAVVLGRTAPAERLQTCTRLLALRKSGDI